MECVGISVYDQQRPGGVLFSLGWRVIGPQSEGRNQALRISLGYLTRESVISVELQAAMSATAAREDSGSASDPP